MFILEQKPGSRMTSEGCSYASAGPKSDSCPSAAHKVSRALLLEGGLKAAYLIDEWELAHGQWDVNTDCQVASSRATSAYEGVTKFS